MAGAPRGAKSMSQPLLVIDVVGRPYGDVLELQRSLVHRRLARELTEDLLLLVEHQPVVTLGRGTRATSLPLAPPELAQRGVEVFEVERGGDVTWHGPGQLVGYPIIDLAGHHQDLHWYLRTLEAVLIAALGRLGVAATRKPGLTGVWTDGRKIASIGVHVKQWVTLHGFALNVSNDLAGFDLIVPCGIDNVVMTSIARELGDRGHSGTLWVKARTAVIEAFGTMFERDPIGAALDPDGTVSIQRTF
jgi:lipoate-protein ligase B